MLVIAAGLAVAAYGAWWGITHFAGDGSKPEKPASSERSALGVGDDANADGESGSAARGTESATALKSTAKKPLLTPEPEFSSPSEIAASPKSPTASRPNASSNAPTNPPSSDRAGAGSGASEPEVTGSAPATSPPMNASTPPTNDSTAAPPKDAGASSLAERELAAATAKLTSEPLQSRRDLTRLLDSSSLDESQRRRAYEAINEVNQPLFFRSGVVQGDPVFAVHRVAEGETPTFIVRALAAKCDSELLLRINGVADARKLRPGQTLKVPKGAFHAEVRKGEFRMNVYHGEGADRVMIASFPVGLGEFNTTPTGIFKVRPRSKLKDPQWRNPRTGEHFASEDPKNPIGERWVGLEGVEPHNQDFAGYGIHGTIEPDSIGQMRSMGCIRMLPADVEVVYEMLTVPESTVLIAP